MKVLIVYSDPNCSCTRKCTFELSRGLSLYTSTDVLHHTQLEELHFLKYDLIIFQRLGGNGVYLHETFYQSLEKMIQKYKGKTYTIYFLDDLILNAGTKRMMSMVDTLLVPNPNYLKYISNYNSSVFYTRTFLDLKEIQSIPRKHMDSDKINILWASTGGVGNSFMQKLIPKIHKRIPKAVIHIIGGSSYIFNKYKNVVTHPILPYEEFIQYFKGCDIYLNPISIDTDYFRNVNTVDFINCKSELKYIIAASVKKPIISSKSQPYEYAIKNGVNGFILDNNEDTWIKHILLLANNNIIKNKLVNNAYEDFLNNYTLKAIGSRMHHLFQNLTKNNKTKTRDISVYSMPKNKIDIEQADGNSTVGEIFGNKKITQSFQCNQNGLYKIDLKFATYMRENKGIIRLSLANSPEGEPLRYQDVPCSDIMDNQWHSFTFEPLANSGGLKYYLRIQGINCRIGSSVTVYFDSKINNNGSLYINRTLFNGSLTFRTYVRGS